VLGRLGDPRFSGELCLPEFIALPAGEFWMGSTEDEVARVKQETGKEWADRELPRHQVRVSVYALAKYATTNAMYAVFLADGWYSDPRWWEGVPGEFWPGDGTVKGWDGTRSKPRYWDDERFNGPN
jgi:formylglycine-generating enzyme required for sulfatase activity